MVWRNTAKWLPDLKHQQQVNIDGEYQITYLMAVDQEHGLHLRPCEGSKLVKWSEAQSGL